MLAGEQGSKWKTVAEKKPLSDKGEDDGGERRDDKQFVELRGKLQGGQLLGILPGCSNQFTADVNLAEVEEHQSKAGTDEYEMNQAAKEGVASVVMHRNLFLLLRTCIVPTTVQVPYSFQFERQECRSQFFRKFSVWCESTLPGCTMIRATWSLRLISFAVLEMDLFTNTYSFMPESYVSPVSTLGLSASLGARGAQSESASP